MVGTKYKIKGVEDDDELLYIGSLFRHAYIADWHIQVRFKKSKKRSVLASLIPDLAIGRTYNRTIESSVKQPTKTIEWSKIVAKVSGKEIGLEPIEGANRNERYLILSIDDCFIAIPRLELARVLFLQNSKMFHYAIDPVALGIDFQSYQPDSQELLIEVNAGAQLSKSRFNDLFNQSKLAYTLCDEEGKKSFLSIQENLLEYRFDKKDSKGNVSSWWTFNFNIPNLRGSEFSVLGYYSTKLWKQKRVYVINEIVGLNKIPNSLPDNIKFFSQDWFKKSTQKTSDETSSGETIPNLYEIDEQATASSFLPERTIASGGISAFSLEPARNTESVATNNKIHLVINGTEKSVSGSDLASTDLPSLLGESSPVILVEDTNEELNETVFKAFKSMVENIGQSAHLNLVSYEVRKLQKVGKSRLHKKTNSNSLRCAAIAHFQSANSFNSISIIEIDLSDFKKTRPLSTLLFKYGCLDEARSRADTVLATLVANSLRWPKKYLAGNKIRAKYVNHPQGHEPTKCDRAFIEVWANKVKIKIKQL